MTETEHQAAPLSEHEAQQSHKNRIAALTLGAIGVVYGDIGTSPLYAFRESISHVKGGGVAAPEVLGVLSLLIWSLIIIVTVKYVSMMMRADNKGEGGILSLLALVRVGAPAKFQKFALAVGMIGAALFIGDAMLTPAISVLSAVEGLYLITPDVEPWILPLTILILLALFLVQYVGTAKVSVFFGPITLLWFIAMAACALPHIAHNPDILWSFSPHYALQFILTNQLQSFVVIGAVFLAVTGAEALYADMGHFGIKPIRLAWFSTVFPALVINYLGQGALVLSNPEAMKNPFFLMAPEWALIPMVILATLATIIASQAVITGAFSLIQQANQLGLIPRQEIRHTSEHESGQIYLPRINMLLAIGVIILVLEFKTSSALAVAYGIAVCGTMIATSILAVLLMRFVWKKSMLLTALVMTPFLLIEATFTLANTTKILDGGYVPLLIGLTLCILMVAWRRGSRRVAAKELRMSLPLEDFIETLALQDIPVVKGTAIYLTENPRFTPTALLHNLKHNKVLHQQNIILSIVTDPTPKVAPLSRNDIGVINDQFIVVKMHYGFMESPNVSKNLTVCRKLGIHFDIMSTSFFVSHRVLKTNAKTIVGRWLDHIYMYLSKNSVRASDFFVIPIDRVVEIGAQTTL